MTKVILSFSLYALVLTAIYCFSHQTIDAISQYQTFTAAYP